MATTTMYNKLYGKMKEPARERRKREARDRNMEEKEKENDENELRGYMSRFNGKNVELKISTGEIIQGVLETSAYNKFDTILANSEGCYLIPKHAIVFIHEKKGGN